MDIEDLLLLASARADAERTPREPAVVLSEVIAWTRRIVLTLARHSRDEVTASSLRVVAMALDPETNPRIRAAYRVDREPSS